MKLINKINILGWLIRFPISLGLLLILFSQINNQKPNYSLAWATENDTIEQNTGPSPLETAVSNIGLEGSDLVRDLEDDPRHSRDLQRIRRNPALNELFESSVDSFSSIPEMRTLGLNREQIEGMRGTAYVGLKRAFAENLRDPMWIEWGPRFRNERSYHHRLQPNRSERNKVLTLIMDPHSRVAVHPSNGSNKLVIRSGPDGREEVLNFPRNAQGHVDFRYYRGLIQSYNSLRRSVPNWSSLPRDQQVKVLDEFHIGCRLAAQELSDYRSDLIDPQTNSWIVDENGKLIFPPRVISEVIIPENPFQNVTLNISESEVDAANSVLSSLKSRAMGNFSQFLSLDTPSTQNINLNLPDYQKYQPMADSFDYLNSISEALIAIKDLRTKQNRGEQLSEQEKQILTNNLQFLKNVSPQTINRVIGNTFASNGRSDNLLSQNAINNMYNRPDFSQLIANIDPNSPDPNQDLSLLDNAIFQLDQSMETITASPGFIELDRRFRQEDHDLRLYAQGLIQILKRRQSEPELENRGQARIIADRLNQYLSNRRIFARDGGKANDPHLKALLAQAMQDNSAHIRSTAINNLLNDSNRLVSDQERKELIMAYLDSLDPAQIYQDLENVCDRTCARSTYARGQAVADPVSTLGTFNAFNYLANNFNNGADKQKVAYSLASVLSKMMKGLEATLKENIESCQQQDNATDGTCTCQQYSGMLLSMAQALGNNFSPSAIIPKRHEITKTAHSFCMMDDRYDNCRLQSGRGLASSYQDILNMVPQNQCPKDKDGERDPAKNNPLKLPARFNNPEKSNEFTAFINNQPYCDDIDIADLNQIDSSPCEPLLTECSDDSYMGFDISNLNQVCHDSRESIEVLAQSDSISSDQITRQMYSNYLKALREEYIRDALREIQNVCKYLGKNESEHLMAELENAKRCLGPEANNEIDTTLDQLSNNVPPIDPQTGEYTETDDPDLINTSCPSSERPGTYQNRIKQQNLDNIEGHLNQLLGVNEQGVIRGRDSNFAKDLHGYLSSREILNEIRLSGLSESFTSFANLGEGRLSPTSSDNPRLKDSLEQYYKYTNTTNGIEQRRELWNKFRSSPFNRTDLPEKESFDQLDWETLQDLGTTFHRMHPDNSLFGFKACQEARNGYAFLGYYADKKKIDNFASRYSLLADFKPNNPDQDFEDDIQMRVGNDDLAGSLFAYIRDNEGRSLSEAKSLSPSRASIATGHPSYDILRRSGQVDPPVVQNNLNYNQLRDNLRCRYQKKGFALQRKIREHSCSMLSDSDLDGGFEILDSEWEAVNRSLVFGGIKDWRDKMLSPNELRRRTNTNEKAQKILGLMSNQALRNRVRMGKFENQEYLFADCLFNRFVKQKQEESQTPILDWTITAFDLTFAIGTSIAVGAVTGGVGGVALAAAWGALLGLKGSTYQYLSAQEQAEVAAGKSRLAQMAHLSGIIGGSFEQGVMSVAGAQDAREAVEFQRNMMMAEVAVEAVGLGGAVKAARAARVFRRMTQLRRNGLSRARSLLRAEREVSRLTGGMREIFDNLRRANPSQTIKRTLHQVFTRGRAVNQTRRRLQDLMESSVSRLRARHGWSLGDTRRFQRQVAQISDALNDPDFINSPGAKNLLDNIYRETAQDPEFLRKLVGRMIFDNGLDDAAQLSASAVKRSLTRMLRNCQTTEACQQLIERTKTLQQRLAQMDPSAPDFRARMLSTDPNNPLREFLSEYADTPSGLGGEVNNGHFVDNFVEGSPDSNIMFTDSSNTVLKQHNDILFHEKELSSGITNYHKALVLEELQEEARRRGITLVGNYSDYKSIRMAFSGDMQAYREAFARARQRFRRTMERLKLNHLAEGHEGRLGNVDHWFLGGTGRTPLRANYANRIARRQVALRAANELDIPPNFETSIVRRVKLDGSTEDISMSEYIVKEMQDMRKLQDELAKIEIFRTSQMDPTGQFLLRQALVNEDGILDPALIEIFRKVPANISGEAARQTHIINAIKKQFGIDISSHHIRVDGTHMSAYQAMNNMFEKADLLSPPNFIVSGGDIDYLHATAGIVGDDFIGVGNLNIGNTMQAARRVNPNATNYDGMVDNVMTNILEERDAVDAMIREGEQALQIAVRQASVDIIDPPKDSGRIARVIPGGKRETAEIQRNVEESIRVDRSGDDMGVAHTREIAFTQEEQIYVENRTVFHIGRDANQSGRHRLSFISQHYHGTLGITDVRVSPEHFGRFQSCAEEVQKSLTKLVKGVGEEAIPPERLSNITIAVRIHPYQDLSGGTFDIIAHGTPPLTQRELRIIRSNMDDAVKNASDNLDDFVGRSGNMYTFKTKSGVSERFRLPLRTQ